MYLYPNTWTMPNTPQHTPEHKSIPSHTQELNESGKLQIAQTISKEFGDRQFDKHDIKQVEESLRAEWKKVTSETLMRDMRDYANKTGGAAWGKVDMAMAA